MTLFPNLIRSIRSSRKIYIKIIMSESQQACISQMQMIGRLMGKIGSFFHSISQEFSEKSLQIKSKRQQQIAQNRQNDDNLSDVYRQIIEMEALEAQEAKNYKKIYRSIKKHKPKHPVPSFFFFYQEKSKEIAKENGEILGSKIAKIIGQIWKKMTPQEKLPYQLMQESKREQYEKEMTNFKLDYPQEFKLLRKIRKTRQQQKQIRKKRQILKKDQEKPEIEAQCQESQLSQDILSNSLEQEVDKNENKSQKASQKPVSKVQKVQNNESKLVNKRKKKKGKSAVQKLKPKGPTSSFLYFYRLNCKELSQKYNMKLGPKLIAFSSGIWNKLSKEQKLKYDELALVSRQKYYKQMREYKQLKDCNQKKP